MLPDTSIGLPPGWPNPDRMLEIPVELATSSSVCTKKGTLRSLPSVTNEPLATPTSIDLGVQVVGDRYQDHAGLQLGVAGTRVRWLESLEYFRIDSMTVLLYVHPVAMSPCLVMKQVRNR